MDDLVFRRSTHLAELAAPALRILDILEPDGRIAWFENGPWDAWNHTECAMALTAMGALEAAALAFDHLAASQRPDGAWPGEYGNALPMVDRDFISREPAPQVLDTNFCAYPAVGVLHYLLATDDAARARTWWPMVRKAIGFVLAHQREDGTVSWAREAVGTAADDALLAGNASIAKSLECAIRLAGQLDQPQPGWIESHAALARALRCRPHLFDRRGTGARFAMDWYYPVLSGALAPQDAAARIGSGWRGFVVGHLGCRCVRDEPWITVAETAELALALIALGEDARAASLLETLFQFRNGDGVYWMGWQFEEGIAWPRETPGWTQAAVILASDAVHGRGAHSRLLARSGTTGGAAGAGS